jgi:hypothetical protein
VRRNMTVALTAQLRGVPSTRNFMSARLTKGVCGGRVTEISIGGLLDLACSELAARPAHAGQPTRMIVHPSVYRHVAQAQKTQVARRLPLMLLGLELQQSDQTPPSGFKIVD